MVPDAIDADTLQGVALGSLVVLAVVAAVVVRLVTKAVVRLVVIALVVAAGIAIWSQRSSLSDCAERARSPETAGPVTCDFFGAEVEVRD